MSDVVVTATDVPATTLGTLVDQLGRPSPEFAVIAFSAPLDGSSAANQRARQDRLDGAFRIRGLPPGEYLLVAVADADPRQLADPTFLEELALGAIRVTLAEGEQKV